MNARAHLRRGWCPSALRPMPSGDGLLVRLSIPGAPVPATLARAIADCARRFGNGLVDLTQRANLQLRGVSDATLPALTTRLAALGLLDREEEPAAARNILASPLAGLDPLAKLDIRRVVAALERRLADDASLSALPHKFCFVIDDGGKLGLDDINADIRFQAIAADDEVYFAIAVGGRSAEAVPIGTCAPFGLPDAAVALAHAFLRLRESEERPRRMRDLATRVGAGAIAEALSGEAIACSLDSYGIDPSACENSRSSLPHKREKRLLPPIGFHRLDSEMGFLGVGAPFGRLRADDLDVLADGAERVEGELRLAPWRVFLVTNIRAAQARELRRSLYDRGLITASDDPRLAVAACPGSPACARATVSTRDDALALASLARGLAAEGVTLHVSGCAKGCARAQPARVTLVGRDGRYDLILDGAADDVPTRQSLAFAEVTAALAQRRPDRAIANELLPSAGGMRR